MDDASGSILGHEFHLSIIPYYVPQQNVEREMNWFMFKFKDRLVEHGPSFLIIEWTEDKNGFYKWEIVPNSPIQDRPDLLDAASKFVDEYYEINKLGTFF